MKLSIICNFFKSENLQGDLAYSPKSESDGFWVLSVAADIEYVPADV